METGKIIFYLISIMIVIFGLLTVTTRKLFRSAIYLLFTLINVAALYFCLNYEFIAAVQIVVYVGGIIVLILFSLFLTQQAGLDLPKPSFSRVALAASLSVFGFIFVFLLFYFSSSSLEVAGPVEVTMKAIGTQMLSFTKNGYVLPFEVVSILLLAAMIGCIAIAFRTKENG